HGPADFNDAVDLGNLGGVFRTTGLEQFRNPGQTAGDVLGLSDFSRSLGEQGAGANLLMRLDNDVRASRDGVARGYFAVVAHDDNLRMQVFLVLDDDRAHEAGRFVDFALDRYARNHVAEFDFTAAIGQ